MARPLICQTCGQQAAHLRRDVVDKGYNALTKPPLWNCDRCYAKKRQQRLHRGHCDMVFLCGFMATGKSKIGYLLAARLGWKMVDTDQLIERRAKRTIAQIFAAQGEAEFRRLERQAVVEATGRDKVVVALGGGAVTQEENWQTMRASGGLVICLAAAVDTILARVERKDDRPLLAGLNTAEKRAKIERMLAERAPFYERADLTLKTGESVSPDATAQEAAECVLALIEERDAVS
jgi:shikimate kinase